MRRMAATLVICGAGLACSGAGVRRSEEPAWVRTGRTMDYPREEYLVGLGRGRSPQVAEDNARAEIAKVFEARVEQTTREKQRYLEGETSAGSGGWSQAIDISQATEVETSRVLSGVEVVERWEGPDGCAALAVLSRREASDRLWQRARELVRRAEALIEAARAAQDPLDTVRSYYQAARLLGLVESLNADLAVLAVRRPIKGPMSAGEAFEAFRATARERVPVVVRMTGDEADRIRAAVEAALTQRGIPIASADQPERILVRGTSSIRPTDRPPREYRFVRYEVSLEAVDTRSGTVWASVGPVSDDASGRTADQAVERAVFLVRERHLPRFIEDLFERLFGAGVENEDRRGP